MDMNALRIASPWPVSAGLTRRESYAADLAFPDVVGRRSAEYRSRDLLPWFWTTDSLPENHPAAAWGKRGSFFDCGTNALRAPVSRTACPAGHRPLCARSR